MVAANLICSNFECFRAKHSRTFLATLSDMLFGVSHFSEVGSLAVQENFRHFPRIVSEADTEWDSHFSTGR